MATDKGDRDHQNLEERNTSEEHPHSAPASAASQPDSKHHSQQQRWSRPQSTYQQHRPTGAWVDPYTKRRASSRAFNRVTQEELEDIVTRLRQSTLSSTGAVTLRDKEFAYTSLKYTKTNPRIERRKPEPRTQDEQDGIAQRLHSAKTRAWIARREKNPNTRVHYSTDFTII